MSQAKKRARSRRRTPSKQKSRGLNIPIVPVAGVVGVIVVVAVVAYLVLQSGSSSSNEEWVDVEADPAPDLPGEFVDIQEIYGGTYGLHGENVTAQHVTREVDYAADGNTNPPAGGPHWGSAACSTDPTDSPAFCGPAPWGVYRDPWDAETVVHNMEHGGVVIWYNTTDQAIIDELESVAADLLDDDKILVLMPYPDLEDEHIALTSWVRIDKFPVSEYTEDRVREYVNVHVRRFNPEGF